MVCKPEEFKEVLVADVHGKPVRVLRNPRGFLEVFPLGRTRDSATKIAPELAATVTHAAVRYTDGAGYELDLGAWDEIRAAFGLRREALDSVTDWQAARTLELTGPAGYRRYLLRVAPGDGVGEPTLELREPGTGELAHAVGVSELRAAAGAGEAGTLALGGQADLSAGDLAPLVAWVDAELERQRGPGAQDSLKALRWGDVLFVVERRG